MATPDRAVVTCGGCGEPFPAAELDPGGRARVVGDRRLCPRCAGTIGGAPEEVEREAVPKTPLPRYRGEVDSAGVDRRSEWQRRKAPEEPPPRRKLPRPFLRRQRKRG